MTSSSKDRHNMWCRNCCRSVNLSDKNTLTVTLTKSDKVSVTKKNILKVTLTKCQRCQSFQPDRVVKLRDDQINHLPTSPFIELQCAYIVNMCKRDIVQLLSPRALQALYTGEKAVTIQIVTFMTQYFPQDGLFCVCFVAWILVDKSDVVRTERNKLN